MVEDRLTNFIPLSRKIFEHKLWTEKRSFSKFEAWVDILKSARFENTEGSILIGYKIIKYKRGQFVASYRFLATRWGWSTKKVGNYLGLLEDENMIKKETPKETGQTIITICKYESYNIVSEKKKQEKKREGNAKETAGKREGNEYNIVNKENKEIKKEATPSVSEVVSYFQEKGFNQEIAVRAFEYYDSNNWFDNKGNQVKNWKMKMQSVWFKPEHKAIKVPEGVSERMTY